MNISFRQLQAFVTVARLGSFTKAATALHTTQPGLSVHIGQLEESLGLRLFDRSTRAVAITAVGRELLPRAERALAEVAAMADSARGLGSRKTGRVAVAALPSVAASLLPEAIAAFGERHPGIAVTLRDALGAPILDMVRNGEVDFGIGAESPSEQGLLFTPLGADEMVAVTRTDHPLAKARRITLEMVAAHPLILMSRGSSVRRHVDEALAERGFLVQPVQEPVYMSTAVAMVRAGLGVALLPSSASELRGATDLAGRHIAHRGMTRPVGIITRRGRTLSPAAQEFEKTLKAVAKRAL